MTIIWNHHEVFIQKSKDIPGFGKLIREIDDVKTFQKLEKAKIPFFCARC